MPVAPVVVLVILVNTVLIHNVGFEEAVPAVFKAATVTDVEKILTFLHGGARASAVIISPDTKVANPVLEQVQKLTRQLLKYI